ncbi:MAG TPA: LysM domain-containing protein, partial [Anaerolineales bacterium]|nr:LysM domain-containing protein [Anaerolineales bacterium]
VPPPTEPPAPPPEPEEPVIPPPVYHVVTVNDTVWGICERYGITRPQFWEWNGHLWDERSLPRDPVYIQEGWRVRVG